MSAFVKKLQNPMIKEPKQI